MMERISDEIRKWCDFYYERPTYKGDFEKLCALADRIDSEMVELPQSADGKTWTGREVCFWTGSANEDWHKFCGLRYKNSMWCVEDVDFERYPAVSVWYERPDSLERIADDARDLVVDFNESANDGTFDSDGIFNRLFDLSDRIRDLAEKEGQK